VSSETTKLYTEQELMSAFLKLLSWENHYWLSVEAMSIVIPAFTPWIHCAKAIAEDWYLQTFLTLSPAYENTVEYQNDSHRDNQKNLTVRRTEYHFWPKRTTNKEHEKYQYCINNVMSDTGWSSCDSSVCFAIFKLFVRVLSDSNIQTPYQFVKWIKNAGCLLFIVISSSMKTSEWFVVLARYTVQNCQEQKYFYQTNHPIPQEAGQNQSSATHQLKCS